MGPPVPDGREGDTATPQRKRAEREFTPLLHSMRKDRRPMMEEIVDFEAELVDLPNPQNGGQAELESEQNGDDVAMRLDGDVGGSQMATEQGGILPYTTHKDANSTSMFVHDEGNDTSMLSIEDPPATRTLFGINPGNVMDPTQPAASPSRGTVDTDRILPAKEQAKVNDELKNTIFQLRLKLHLYEKRLDASAPASSQELLKENLHLNEVLITKQHEVDELRDALKLSGDEDFGTNRDAIIDQIQDLTAAVRERDEILKEREMIIMENENLLTELRDEFEAKDADIFRLRQQVADLQAQLQDESEAVMSEYQQKQREMDRQTNHLNEELSSAAAEAQRMRAQQTALMERNASLEAQLDKERQITRELREKVNELQVRVEARDSRSHLFEQRLEAERATSKAASDAARTQIDELRRQLSVKDTELQSLRVSGLNIQSECDSLKKQYDHRILEDAKLENRMEKMQSTIDALRMDADKASKEAMEARQQLSQALFELSTCKERITKYEAEIRLRNTENDAQSAEIKRLRDELKRVHESKTEEHRVAVLETERLQKQVTELTIRLTDLNTQHEKLEDRCRRAEDAQRDSSQLNKQKEQSLLDLQPQLQSALNKIRILEAEKQRLERELDLAVAAQRPFSRDTEREQGYVDQVASLKSRLEDQRIALRRANDDFQRERTLDADKIGRLEEMVRQYSEQEQSRLRNGMRADSSVSEILERERARYESQYQYHLRDFEMTKSTLQDTVRQLNDARDTMSAQYKELVELKLKLQRLQDIANEAELLIAEKDTSIRGLQESIRLAEDKIKGFNDKIMKSHATEQEAQAQARQATFELEQLRIEAQSRIQALQEESELAIQRARHGADQIRLELELKYEAAKNSAEQKADDAVKDAERARIKAVEEAQQAVKAKCEEIRVYYEQETAKRVAKVSAPLNKGMNKAINSLDIILQYHAAKDLHDQAVQDDLLFIKDFACLCIQKFDANDRQILLEYGISTPKRRTFAGAANAILALVRMRGRRRPAVPRKLERRYNKLMEA